MIEEIIVIWWAVSIVVSVLFGGIGDLFACKIIRRAGYLPSDTEHGGLIIAALFCWNIGILWFWLYPGYAYEQIKEYYGKNNK